MISVPGEDASDEDKAKFRAALGVPDSPDGYEIKLPDPKDLPEELHPNEQTQTKLASFVAALHAVDAPPAVIQAAVDWYYGDVKQTLGDHVAALKEYKSTQDAALKAEWGNDYKANVTLGNRTIHAFVADEKQSDALLGLELKEGGLLGAHPTFNRFAAAVGRGMGEHRPGLTMSDEDKKSGEARLDALTRDIWTAQDQGDSDLVAKLSAERDELSRSLYGSSPLVGRDGRTT